MLLKISQEIGECLTRAAEARENAESAKYPEIKEGYLDMERNWMRLADRFRFVESAARFLDDASRSRLSIKAPSILKADNSHVTPIVCEICRGHAHLTDCTPCTISVDVREIWTFRCEGCGEDLKRVVEK